MVEARHSRVALLLGEEAVARLNRSFVTVVGLGAVGSFAVEALARAGVGRFRLVDSDVLCPSNLNRQLYALESTLGRPKVEVACARLQDIAPRIEVEGLQLRVNAETVARVLEPAPDLVLDAVDSLEAKLALLLATHARGVGLLCSLGAARRLDPGAVRVAPLSQTTTCPLAREMRRRLREGRLAADPLCVFSVEPRVRNSMGARPEPWPPGIEKPPGLPRRPLGSLPTITGIFGLTLAHAALSHLIGRPPTHR